MNHGYFLSLPSELKKELQRFQNYSYFVVHKNVVELLVNSLEFILLEDHVKKILNFTDILTDNHVFLRIIRDDQLYGGKLSYHYHYNSVNSNVIIMDFFTIDNVLNMIIRLYKFLRKHGFIEFSYVYVDIVNSLFQSHKIIFIPRGKMLHKYQLV